MLTQIDNMIACLPHSYSRLAEELAQWKEATHYIGPTPEDVLHYCADMIHQRDVQYKRADRIAGELAAARVKILQLEYDLACAQHGGGPSAECSARYEAWQEALRDRTLR